MKKGVVRTWLAPKNCEAIQLKPVGGSAGESPWRATRDRHDFYVFLDITGNGRHHCTCAQDDSRPAGKRFRVHRQGAGMFCRHIVAAAMQASQQALLLPLLVG